MQLARHLLPKCRESEYLQSLALCIYCVYPAQGQMHLQRAVHRQQVQEMLQARVWGFMSQKQQGSGLGSARRAWCWHGDPKVLRTCEQQALMPRLRPWWHCRCTMLQALGSAARMRSRCQCNDHWASDHVARDMQQAPVLWALGSVILHAHNSLCP